jgi:hypothetical protein
MLAHIADMYAHPEATAKDAKPLPYLDRLLDAAKVWT